MRVKFIYENKVGSLPGMIVCAWRINIACEPYVASKTLTTKWVQGKYWPFLSVHCPGVTKMPSGGKNYPKDYA